MSASGAPAAATSLTATPKTVLDPLLMPPALLQHDSVQLSFFFFFLKTKHQNEFKRNNDVETFEETRGRHNI